MPDDQRKDHKLSHPHASGENALTDDNTLEFRIGRMELKPDDILVVSYRTSPTRQRVAQMIADMKRFVPNRIMVFEDDTELKVLVPSPHKSGMNRDRCLQVLQSMLKSQQLVTTVGELGRKRDENIAALDYAIETLL